ncbi:hypothetical protein DGG96_12130 [Legionella qingyii]|uniref:Uncharacterized protein n=1 Tax=Legionella qingyii TaxID=2184757 RepID=A0A317U0K8_9GAMM|nr:hypothetical protein [Legionella qingyii]PWY55371.1 hypothetical protein DGG96_12130 [Legionella qingyii]RUR21227.1 hypothetical protein ELY20_13045 [Legionella qingyii]RUR23983.1 hypothetical protein ELY16_12270 [Legionella qingyii]
MPDFSSSITEIANYIGQKVYLKSFPESKEIDSTPKRLNRDVVMEKVRVASCTVLITPIVLPR